MVFSEEGEAGLAGLNGIQEVTGSIPVISTTGSAGPEALIFLENQGFFCFFTFCLYA